jgi:hypothetical protein
VQDPVVFALSSIAALKALLSSRPCQIAAVKPPRSRVAHRCAAITLPSNQPRLEVRFRFRLQTFRRLTAGVVAQPARAPEHARRRVGLMQ